VLVSTICLGCAPVNGGVGAAAEQARNESIEDCDDTLIDRAVVALHGKITQIRRTRALTAFSTTSNALLMCTDVAARGLDIPDVDYVVQFDPPKDPDAHVHSVGRTARLVREGTSFIYLAPHQDAYSQYLVVCCCAAIPQIISGEEGHLDADFDDDDNAAR
jgi:ERCC4-related helicase